MLCDLQNASLDRRCLHKESLHHSYSSVFFPQICRPIHRLSIQPVQLNCIRKIFTFSSQLQFSVFSANLSSIHRFSIQPVKLYCIREIFTSSQQQLNVDCGTSTVILHTRNFYLFAPNSIDYGQVMVGRYIAILVGRGNV